MAEIGFSRCYLGAMKFLKFASRRRAERTDDLQTLATITHILEHTALRKTSQDRGKNSHCHNCYFKGKLKRNVVFVGLKEVSFVHPRVC